MKQWGEDEIMARNNDLNLPPTKTMPRKILQRAQVDDPEVARLVDIFGANAQASVSWL